MSKDHKFLPVGAGAQVTMSMHDYRLIENEMNRLKDLIATQASAPEAGGPEETQRLSELRRALEHALPIVHHAIGNLPPESTPNWPFEDLKALGELLTSLFQDNSNIQTIGIDFKSFAEEARQVEAYRETRYRAAQAQLSDTVQLEDGQQDPTAVGDQDPDLTRGPN